MSVIGIVYASLTTIRQIDLKKIIAYSSVAHMNFVTIGLFSHNIQGIEGSIMLMLSHGLISSALFLSIGVIYDRFHTRLLPYYGGLTHFMPVYSIVFLFFTFANISFPGTASFVGELFILLGIFQANPFVAILASTGVVLGAVYSIWLANRLLYGPFNQHLGSIYDNIDMNHREVAIIAPLILGTLVMGIYPDIFLHAIHSSTIYMLELIQGSL
jgi:NADH:ubiquinone oxidoreductase subunit 4 (subunit M)